MNISIDVLIKKAGILIEALPYIQKLSGKTVVIKYGGNAMLDDGVKRTVAADVAALTSAGMHPILVHGGGPAISEHMERLSLRPRFIDGHRVTSPEVLEVVEMVLSGKVNREIVALLNAQGVRAIGISGKDGRLAVARKHYRSVDRDGTRRRLDLGRVGELVSVDTSVIRDLLAGGFVPVVSPIATGEDLLDYNINADAFAGHLALALGAHRLIYLTDVDGLMGEPGRSETLIPKLDCAGARRCLEGAVSGGMIPKVESAVKAVEGGVGRAHIINGTAPHSILGVFSDGAPCGTMIIR